MDEVLIGRMNAAASSGGGQLSPAGRGARGNVPLLRRLCAARGDHRHGGAGWSRWGGRPVSSTGSGELLRAGQVEQANEMLGAPYALVAPVAHGKQIGGAKLGFPTINQRYAAGMLLPRSGVYLTQAVVAGRRYPAATGLGDRPTVNGIDITCESFLIGFDGNLYGDEVRLEFFHYLEPTRRFDSLEGLRDCIADAASRSNALFLPPAGCRSASRSSPERAAGPPIGEALWSAGERNRKKLYTAGRLWYNNLAYPGSGCGAPTPPWSEADFKT